MRKVDPALLDNLENATRGPEAIFGGHSVLLVPPRVEFAHMPAISMRTDKDTPHVIYPTPWEVEQPPIPGSIAAPIITHVDGVQALQDAGWQRKTTTHGLLNEFLDLASFTLQKRTGLQRDKAGRELLARVQAFAHAWGPLWQCRTPGHSPFCHCAWTLPSIGWQQDPPCCWAPAEEVLEFVDAAKEARATLDATSRLRDGDQVPPPLLKHLSLEPGAGTAAVRKRIETLINLYLVHMGGPTLSVAWRASPRPTLHINTGLGFLWAVWLEIAQALCHGTGIASCANCGQFYFPTRAPRKDQRHFCPNCREQRKKLDARNRRAQHGKDEQES